VAVGHALGLAACASDFADPYLVLEHRLLAARTEVIAPLVPEEDTTLPPRVQVMPLETVQIQLFAVGPEGALAPEDVDPIWIACELFSGRGPFACIQEAFPTELSDIPECPTSVEPEPQEREGPCLMGRTGVPEYVVPLTPGFFAGAEVEVTIIASSPGGTSTDECARELLAGETNVPNDCLYGVQRISLGPIGRFVAIAESMGVELDFEPEGIDPNEEPDRHLDIDSVEVQTLDQEGKPVGDPVDVARGGEVTARRGQTLEISITLPPEQLQTYRIPVNNGASFEDREEGYEGTWLRTWGEVEADEYGTERPAEWKLAPGEDDEEDPPGNTPHVYLVARDTRLGVDWWWFSVALAD